MDSTFYVLHISRACTQYRAMMNGFPEARKLYDDETGELYTWKLCEFSIPTILKITRMTHVDIVVDPTETETRTDLK
jgi:hypothetical protein